MTATRQFGTFAIVFAVAYPIVYVTATEWNLAAFTYHSAIGQFTLGPSKPIAGPAMYWYGWITTTTVAAGIVAAVAAYLPGSLMQRLPPATAGVIPILAMATMVALMIKMYFTR